MLRKSKINWEGFLFMLINLLVFISIGGVMMSLIICWNHMILEIVDLIAR